MSTGFSTIDVGTEDGVFTITLNRPDSMNAFNDQMGIEVAAALKAAQRDKGVRCVVMTGAGRAFCAGQDLAAVQQWHKDAGADGSLDFGGYLRNRLNPLVSRMRTLEKPILAAVNGPAAGAGASFALACDLRICAREAYFSMAFVHVGLVPDAGSTQTLMQHVGYAKAAEMCLLGERMSAEEALQHGLVSRVVDAEMLQITTAQIAGKLAALPTRAIGLTKRALNHAWTATLDDQLEYEAFMQQSAGQTADHREGVAAFLEKRKPTFAGK